MIIGVDIDDVLCQFNLAFDKYHNEKYGTNVLFDDHNTYDYLDLYKISRGEFIERLGEFFTSNYHKEMEPIYGAEEALKEISKKHKIQIITARTQDFKDYTLEWLNKHYKDIYISVHHANHYYGLNLHKKSDLCKKLNVELLIDDSLEFSEECAEEGIKVLMLDSPWNQKEKLHKNITRVRNWKEILKKVDEIENNVS